MNSKKTIYQVPVPSTDFTTEAVLCGNVIRFGYRRQDTLCKNGIRFKRVKAVRTRAESSCTEWHIEGAYDTLVEIEGSSWVEELQTDTADRRQRLGEKWEIHHYMIYLDKGGLF